MRNRGRWTDAKESYLGRVQEVLEALTDYWPLTLRQVYYRLVAAGFIDNSRNSYQKLSRILSQARIDGLVPWDALEDRARSMLGSAGWEDAGSFVDDQTQSYLAGYRRDLLQGQKIVPELWVEKDALSAVVHRAAFDYCTPVIVARGFSSVSFLDQARRRILNNAKQSQRTIILYFGDLDPSGWEMLPSMMTTLAEEMELEGLVEGVRCALTERQVSEYDLPRNPDALKRTDSRARKYMERFGDLAVELDALEPSALESIVRQTIEAHLDMDRFGAEREREALEQERIDDLKEEVGDFVAARQIGDFDREY